MEWPVALAGQFEARFLALPREVLISTLQEHQRYFALEDATARCCRGSSRSATSTARARAWCAPATSAWCARAWPTRRSSGSRIAAQPLAARRAALDERHLSGASSAPWARAPSASRRWPARSQQRSAPIGAQPRAPRSCAKCDLLTAMVGEFPELQGIMGRYYALADGEPAAVAEAIREHYLPRGAGDALPASRRRRCAGARRQARYAGRHLRHRPEAQRHARSVRPAARGDRRAAHRARARLELDLLELHRAARCACSRCRTSSARASAGERETSTTIVIERLRAQYLERAAEQRHQHRNVRCRAGDAATLAAGFRCAAARAGGLRRDARRAPAWRRPTSASPTSCANRDRGAAAARSSATSCCASRRSAQLHRRTAARARAGASTAIRQRDYAQRARAAGGAATAVDAFFDHVLVNDPDPALRNNRLALLAELRALFGGIADLSRLPG